MNIAAQHTHLYSPFISSLKFVIDCPQLWAHSLILISVANTALFLRSIDSDLNFYGVAISNPVNLMKKWLVASASILTSVSGEEIGYIFTHLYQVVSYFCAIFQLNNNKKGSCYEASQLSCKIAGCILCVLWFTSFVWSVRNSGLHCLFWAIGCVCSEPVPVYKLTPAATEGAVFNSSADAFEGMQD